MKVYEPILVDPEGSAHVVSGLPAIRTGHGLPVPYRRVIDVKPVRRKWFSRWKRVPWSDLFRVVEPTYVTFKITPNSSTRNWRTEDLTKTIADQFRLPIDRMEKGEGVRFRYHVQDRASYEIVFEDERVRFYFSVPETVAPLMRRRLGAVWPDARIEEAPDYSCHFDKERTSVYELAYRKHHLYSLHTDAKDNLPLGSLFEAGQLVGKGERARVFAYFEPIHYPSYASEMRKTWKDYRAGKVPRMLGGGVREGIKLALSSLSELMRELVGGVSEIMNDVTQKRKEGLLPLDYQAHKNAYAGSVSDPEASADAIGMLRTETREKPNKQATKTYLWVMAETESRERSDMICRTMGSAFTDLSGDNELTFRPLRGAQKSEALRTVETKRGPRLRLHYNLTSTAEAAKIVQIPGRELIEKHPDIDHLDMKEVQVAKALLGEGMLIGEVQYRGERFTIRQPCAERDWDEICLPSIYIGGMGQGKTRGAAANRVVEAVRMGYGALAIDPAMGEIGDEVEAMLGPDQVERYNLATLVFSLDWREMFRSPKSKSKMANTIFTFFEGGEGTTAADLLQTRRFFRAAIMGMQSGKLREVLDILQPIQDDALDRHLRKVIHALPAESLHRRTLEEFQGYGTGRRTQIMSPIMNRLEMILGDEHLAECFEADEGLDLVELTSKRKAIIFDVPAGADGLGEEGADLVINLLFTKLQLAMHLRAAEDRFPFFIVMDEPAQFLRSQYLWKKLVVQSRKWRFGLVFMFHLFEQLDRNLIRTIKAALPHWHIYSSSVDTFETIKREIAPFNVEDGLKLKKHHTINVMRVNGEYQPPFIARMAAPPSMRAKEVSHEA